MWDGSQCLHTSLVWGYKPLQWLAAGLFDSQWCISLLQQYLGLYLKCLVGLRSAEARSGTSSEEIEAGAERWADAVSAVCRMTELSPIGSFATLKASSLLSESCLVE